jgi:protein-tyrosine phosphatase
MNGVELHFHALPGIDDGPATMAESVDLLWTAAADGTGTVVTTPHVRTDFVTDVSDLPDRVRELQSEVDASGFPISLHCGGELGHDMVGRLTQVELDTIAQGPPNARWLLVEAPFDGIEWEFHAALEELRDRGFGVVIAHPERSADAILNGAEGLRREVGRGAVGLVNAQSITGAHGPAARQAAFELVFEGVLRGVSSDAHGASRPPLLREAHACLVQGGLPAGVSRNLTAGCPRRLLERGVRSALLHVA